MHLFGGREVVERAPLAPLHEDASALKHVLLAFPCDGEVEHADFCCVLKEICKAGLAIHKIPARVLRHLALELQCPTLLGI